MMKLLAACTGCGKKHSTVTRTTAATAAKSLPAAFAPNFGAAYAAAKAGAVAFTKSTAVQYVDDNIRANVIAPGAMDTPGGVSISGKGIFKGHNLRRNRMIWDRAGKPEDIAAATAYLLSDEAGYITGTTLDIDGGMLALLTDIPKRVEE